MFYIAFLVVFSLIFGMEKMIKWRHSEIQRLIELRGIITQNALARKLGMSRQQLSLLLTREEISGVPLGTVDKLCIALSSDTARLRLEDLVEYIPDP